MYLTATPGRSMSSSLTGLCFWLTNHSVHKQYYGGSQVHFGGRPEDMRCAPGGPDLSRQKVAESQHNNLSLGRLPEAAAVRQWLPAHRHPCHRWQRRRSSAGKQLPDEQAGHEGAGTRNHGAKRWSCERACGVRPKKGHFPKKAGDNLAGCYYSFLTVSPGDAPWMELLFGIEEERLKDLATRAEGVHSSNPSIFQGLLPKAFGPCLCLEAHNVRHSSF